MTPKERMGAFMAGEAIDRVPVIPLILNHATRIAGMTVKEYSTDGKTMGEAHVAAYRHYGQDMITIFSSTSVLAQTMGTTLYQPDDDVARVDVPIVQSHDDVDNVVDADPQDENSMRIYLDAVGHCAREVGEEVFVSCCFAAPFTTAAALRGTEALARDLRRDPALAEALLEKSLAVGIRFIHACAAAGGLPAIVDPVATGSVLSEEMFRTFALPYLAKQVEAIQENGLPALVHVCGKTHRLLEALADTGCDILSLDVIDMAEAKERIGDRVTLLGNVRPAETLLEGTPESVEAEVIEVLRKAGDSPRGFILASGCEVPLHSPQENIEALIAAADRWGKLPLQLPA